MYSFKLPLAEQIEVSNTGYRKPKRDNYDVGSYVTIDASVSVEDNHYEVWRTEVALGVYTHLETRLSRFVAEDKINKSKGQLLEHIYGPIEDELIQVMIDMKKEGYHRGNPAYDRVNNMLNTLSDYFKG